MVPPGSVDVRRGRAESSRRTVGSPPRTRWDEGRSSCYRSGVWRRRSRRWRSRARSRPARLWRRFARCPRRGDQRFAEPAQVAPAPPSAAVLALAGETRRRGETTRAAANRGARHHLRTRDFSPSARDRCRRLLYNEVFPTRIRGARHLHVHGDQLRRQHRRRRVVFTPRRGDGTQGNVRAVRRVVRTRGSSS